MLVAGCDAGFCCITRLARGGAAVALRLSSYVTNPTTTVVGEAYWRLICSGASSAGVQHRELSSAPGAGSRQKHHGPAYES